MVLLIWTWLALILRITRVNSFVEVVLCIRSSPKIKWNRYMRKMRIFGSVAVVHRCSLNVICELLGTKENRNQEYLKITPLSMKLMTDTFHLIHSGNQYVFQNHLTVVGSEMINIHENRIGLIIFDR